MANAKPIDVLIIAALQDELDAVLKHFDEGWAEQRDRQGHTYFTRNLRTNHSRPLSLAAIMAREWLTSRKMPLFSLIRGQTQHADFADRVPPGMETITNSVANVVATRMPNGKDGTWTYLYCPAKPGSGRVSGANLPTSVENSAGKPLQT